MDPNIFNTKEKHYIPKLNEIVKKYDKNNNKVIQNYTINGYILMDLYWVFKHFNIDKNIGFEHFSINEHDLQESQKLVNSADNLFININKDKEYIDIIDKLFSDHFYVMSSVIFSFYDYNNGKIGDDISNSQTIGSIIHIPCYLSTTYQFSKDWSKFLSYKNIIYKIKINKKSDKLLFVDEVSNIPSEREILLQHGCYFKILNIDFQPVILCDNNFHVKIITLELLDSINNIGGGDKQIILPIFDLRVRELNTLNYDFFKDFKYQKIAYNISHLNTINNLSITKNKNYKNNNYENKNYIQSKTNLKNRKKLVFLKYFHQNLAQKNHICLEENIITNI